MYEILDYRNHWLYSIWHKLKDNIFFIIFSFLEIDDVYNGELPTLFMNIVMQARVKRVQFIVWSY